MTALATTTKITLPEFKDEDGGTLASMYAERHAAVEAKVLAFRVTDADTLAEAARMASVIKETRDMLARELEPATKLRQAANDISARWNPAIKPLDRCMEHLRKEESAQIQRARAAVAPMLAQATSQAEVETAAALIAPAPAGIQVRESWSAEVTFTPAQMYAALAAIDDPRVKAVLAVSLPAEYLLVDQSRLDREARANKEAFAVTGARAAKHVAVAHV